MSLQLTLEGPVVQTAIAPYRQELAAILDGQADAIGYAVAVNGKVIAVDVYASPVLFRKLWPKLRQGSATEAFIEAESGRVFPVVAESDVRSFLKDAAEGIACDEAVTERTYLQLRKASRTLLFDSCDCTRGNRVLHRSILVRKD